MATSIISQAIYRATQEARRSPAGSYRATVLRGMRDTRSPIPIWALSPKEMQHELRTRWILLRAARMGDSRAVDILARRYRLRLLPPIA